MCVRSTCIYLGKTIFFCLGSTQKSQQLKAMVAVRHSFRAQKWYNCLVEKHCASSTRYHSYRLCCSSCCELQGLSESHRAQAVVTLSGGFGICCDCRRRRCWAQIVIVSLIVVVDVVPGVGVVVVLVVVAVVVVVDIFHNPMDLLCVTISVRVTCLVYQQF